jgi:hypothetical protein
MDKLKTYMIVGLKASVLLIAYYIFQSLAPLIFHSIPQWLKMIKISPLLVICIFFALRYLLVIVWKLNRYRTMISAFLTLQVLIFLFSIGMILHLIPAKISMLPLLIMGLSMIVLWIWFLISVTVIRNDEIKAFTFLRLFVISFFVVILIKTISSFLSTSDYESLNTIIHFIEALPYIFLVVFFYCNMYNTGNSPEIKSANG